MDVIPDMQIIVAEVTAIADSATALGMYANINLKNNETANKSRAIIPLGVTRKNGACYLGILAPYNSAAVGIKCMSWGIDVKTAGPWIASFLCIL